MDKYVYTLDGRLFKVINFSVTYVITVSMDIYDGKKNRQKERKNKALLSLVKKENEEDNAPPPSMILVTEEVEIKVMSWSVSEEINKDWIIAECIVDIDVTNL